MSEDITNEVEQKQDTEEKPHLVYRRWAQEIDRANKYFKKYHDRCKKIIELYRDDSKSDKGGTRFNIFWSSVQTKKSMIFSRIPPVVVKRRIEDSNPVTRAASEILERATEFCCDDYPLIQELMQVRDDFILCGRGQAWVRYIPKFNESIGVDGQPVKIIESEEVRAEYVNRTDYLHSPARTEQEITWKARRVFQTRKEIEARFGEEIASKIDLTNKPYSEEKHGGEEDKEVIEQFSKAVIYEIWDKTTKKVYWISQGYKDGPLDVIDDPLGLKDFFPCPKPASGTMTNESTIPVPEFALCQDIVDQLNNVTERIGLITDALAVRGVYDSAQGCIEQLLSSRVENQLIPVENWAGLIQGGGLKGVVDFLPLDMLVATLKILYEIKDSLKQTYYEVSGDSDIMRGATNPNETATAQSIKSNYQNTRLTDPQNEMARFTKDIIALMGEVVSKWFQAETLAQMVGYEGMNEQDKQLFPQAFELLKSDLHRRYQIDIETDATIQPNENQEKQNRIDFTGAITQFLTQALPIAAQVPMTAPLVGELLKFITRGFKIGREMEGIIDQTTQALGQMAQQAQEKQGQPDPRAQAAQMQLQAKAQSEQARIQLDTQKQQVDTQLRIQEMQDKKDLEIAKLRGQLEIAQQKLDAEMSLKHMQQASSEKMQIINAQNKNMS